MTKFHTIELSSSGIAGNIILNRPEVHNAFNEIMISEIRNALRILSNKENVRVIVIKANGKSFSSGADLLYMKKQAEMTEDENLKDSEKLARLFYEIYRTPRPVITLSHGHIAGGANGIIAASDFAITAENAHFRFSEVHLGLVPATISPYVLDRMGRARTLELMLSGREFTGKEAETYGLVNRSVPAELLESEMETVLKSFHKSGPDALIKTKKLILQLNEEGSKENMIKFTAEIIAGARASDEGIEGITSFFEAYFISGETLRDNYLNIDKIIEVAGDTNAEAIHPGYGFLSENPDFSNKVARAGINFIGPPGDVIKLMGNKIEARSVAEKAGIPLIPGYEGKAEDLYGVISKIEYPCIVKAAAGGGGKAMRIIDKADDFKDAVESTGREALNYFGDDTLYIEKYFQGGRHIEVQVLVDHYGKIILAGERDCSLQRRHQKVVEETPSVFLNEITRKKIYEVSRKILEEISYVNAGTIEFLVDEQQNFYFLEMNTRIQVEHPVTEESTGIDLVEQQIYIAAGNPLLLDQADVNISKHSIQARIYAEDPAKNFLPSPGRIHRYYEPVFPGLRIDSGINSPGTIHPDYDPMISKVIVSEGTRAESIRLLEDALKNYQVTGLHTNREFILSVLRNRDFIENRISTTWLEVMRSRLLEDQEKQRKMVDIGSIFASWLLKVLFTGLSGKKDPWHVVGYWRHQMRKSIIFDNKQYDIFVSEKKKDRLIFDWDGNYHEVLLQSMNDNKIIFHLNGDWKCASVTSGKGVEDIVFINGYEFRIKPLDYLPLKPFYRERDSETLSGPRIIRSPLHGRIVKLNASLNQRINRGELLFTLDAMKIENRIVSPYEGCIKEIRINEGDQVSIEQEILVIDDCN